MRLSYCFASATPAAFFCLVCLHLASGFVAPIPRGAMAAMSTKLGADIPTQAEASAAAAAAAAAGSAVRPEILPANAPLPFMADGITVVSFNVLLPNGNDGWWIYKVRGTLPSTPMTFLGVYRTKQYERHGTAGLLSSFFVLRWASYRRRARASCCRDITLPSYAHSISSSCDAQQKVFPKF